LSHSTPGRIAAEIVIAAKISASRTFSFHSAIAPTTTASATMVVSAARRAVSL